MNTEFRCDVITLHRFFGKKWTFELFTHFNTSPLSFNNLYAITKHKINPTLLSERLKEMQLHGLITRRETPQSVTYSITSKGKELQLLLHNIKEWTEKRGGCVPTQCKGKMCRCTKPFERGRT